MGSPFDTSGIKGNPWGKQHGSDKVGHASSDILNSKYEKE